MVWIHGDELDEECNAFVNCHALGNQNASTLKIL